MATELAIPAGAALVPAADPSVVARIKSSIDITDRALITTFGDRAQRDATSFADKILAQTRNKDMGKTGDILLDVIDKARSLDAKWVQNPGFISGLLSSVESRLRKFIGQFEDVAGQIEGVVIDLERHKDGLRRDLSMLDDLHEQTAASIVSLEAHIEAGKAFGDEYRNGELKRLQDVARASEGDGNGLLAAQAYQDAAQALDRLDKRVFYLQQARQIAIQQLPQIRIVQSGDETLIENLDATIGITIPAWKQKMVILLGLNRQQSALEMNRHVTDATNAMMREASEMMKTQSIEIERQAQRGVVDIETLEKTNRDLIETVTGVARIQEEGRVKRAAVERRMDELTVELKNALTVKAA